MGTRENKVERHLDAVVSSSGGMTRKWVSPGHVGVPDRIVIMPATATEMINRLKKLPPHSVVADIRFVEVKNIKGELSVRQTMEHARLLRLGCRVATVYGEDGVDSYLKESLT